MFKKITLDNGLRIITAPMRGTNTVTVLVLCGTGSDYESKETGGISHFLEHMFFKGTKKRPAPEIVAEELDGMGSVHNAFTSHETTGYFIKAGKDYLHESLDILADIYHNSLLDAREIEKERQVIVEEMHMRQDTPQEYVGVVWERLLYQDQPAGLDIIGKEETIRALRRQDFADYFYHQYVASNTVVVMAGNFDEGPAVDLVKSLFASLRSDAPARAKPGLKEEQATPASSLFYKETDQTHVMLGFRGYDALNPRRFDLEVLAAILGSGMSSRMFIKVREKMGLAYAVGSDNQVYSNRGYLVTYAGVDHKNVEKAVKAILEEYKRILNEEVSLRELQRVKDYIRGTTLIGLEQSNAVANFVGGEEMITGKPRTVEEVFAKIEAVTPESLRGVAQEVLRPERLNLAMVGPFKDPAPFQKFLSEF